MNDKKDCKIKIIKNGPYIVSGNVPLEEKIITEKKHGYEYKNGKKFESKETYSLCRCGQSKNMPYCDGSHTACDFDGEETASKDLYLSSSEIIEGPDLVLTDKKELCAFARFCHEEHGSVWSLLPKSNNKKLKKEAIKAASECPAGRLVAWDKETKLPFEPKFEPSIVIIQDPSRNCSGPLWIRGRIPIESADGIFYEIRNRVTLCRCGKSYNKPFCDANHVLSHFSDKK